MSIYVRQHAQIQLSLTSYTSTLEATTRIYMINAIAWHLRDGGHRCECNAGECGNGDEDSGEAHVGI